MLRRTADSLLDTNHFYVFYKVLFSSPKSIVECCDLLSLLQSGSRDKKANKNPLLHFPSLSHNFGSAPSMFWFYKRQFYGKQHNTIKGNTMTKQDIRKPTGKCESYQFVIVTIPFMIVSSKSRRSAAS